MSKRSKALALGNRAVLKLTGTQAQTFLQGMITNDINKLSENTPLYAALLTPQGKYLFDFILYQHGEVIFLDCEKARKVDLIQRLTFYKLRAEVQIEDVSDQFSVWAVTNGIFLPDPRCKDLGGRAILDKAPEGQEEWAFEDYEHLRLSLGIPDGSRDIEVDQRFILEANLAELNAVDFKKGCYVGQEMTARMNYRGTLKKRLLPAKFEGTLPAPGTPFTAGGKNAGHVLSGHGDLAMTLTRLEFLNKTPFETEGGVKISPYIPRWLSLDD